MKDLVKDYGLDMSMESKEKMGTKFNYSEYFNRLNNINYNIKLWKI